ncbi:hypothetical protein TSUD_212730 [Trifolium subterraneum]|uniref:Integrase catalytic domain-containing protein n=1 Tax=Trifolium subterraneum TaxID=3900 RepID=A0A2Z6NB48_TRISU|nr:hypothetical protein TSUD_212730 [Trifolium subterraneum]
MAETSTFIQPSIPKFDGHYDHWAMLMENLLRSKELWSPIEVRFTSAPANATAEQQRIAQENQLKDLKVKNYLFQAIDRTILETILNRNTSFDIWEALKTKYQGSTKVKRAQLQALRREFEVLTMGESESVNDYFARTLAIANRMTTHGETVEQVTVVEKILRSMPERFNYVVCSIEQSTDVTTMSIDELQSSLLVQEGRMKGQKQSTDEQALKMAGASRGNGRGRGRNSMRGRGRGRTNKYLVQCYKCHKFGHYQNECPEWENANYCEIDEEEMLLMADTSFNCNTTKEEVWYLDSGCSNHMTGTREWMHDFNDKFTESVKLGDDSKMAVMGKGNVKMNNGGKLHIITDVYYIPGLSSNLLSVGQLQQKNLTIVFKHDVCQIVHNERGLILTTQISANRMYMIFVPMVLPTYMQVSKVNETQLWHNRYAHLSLKSLKTLNQKKMVKGLLEVEDIEDKCVDCLSGKKHRDSIPKNAVWRASNKLELVHSDICGPINPTSNGGNRYFITFTNDFTRKTWIYFLHEKSEALDCFKKFKTLVEKQSNCALLCLRTDRGGEFTSNTFNEFCSTQGIKRQLTAVYTPQQNGVSERKNRTILNMVRSMISARNVPKRFWPEAVNWATYVMNRSLTHVVQDLTPEEAWSGVKPSVHHFRVFGCVAHVHIPDVNRKKLDGKSVMCILLGKSWNWNKQETSSGEGQTLDIDESNGNVIGQEEAEAHNDNTNHDGNEVNEDIQQDGYVSDSSDSDELTPRTRRPPSYLRDYVTNQEQENETDEIQNLALLSFKEDPDSYEEAIKHEVWKKAMESEIEAIKKNDTWELTDLPQGVKPIGVKWIYKTKYNENGKIDKHKARLVAKGYAQKHGIDYSEVFAPMARWDTIRTILSLAALNDWCVFQLDVKSAFLHGELSEDVYVNQPLGFQASNQKLVYKLKKALYGLKQSSRAWYSKIESYFIKEQFAKCPHEHTLFVKNGEGDKILIVSLYVDDLIYTGNDNRMMEEFKSSMKEKFAMTDLGKMKYFLGVEVSQSPQGIFIHQHKYASEILQRFGMEECNKVSSPIVSGCKLVKDEKGQASDATYYKQVIGCLMYLLATRPDMAFSICLATRYMDRPTEMHMEAVKRILRYLKGTMNYGIWYKHIREGKVTLVGWTDSDYAGDYDDRKSTSGYVFTMGTGAISWSSKKQPLLLYLPLRLSLCQLLHVPAKAYG